MEIGELSYLQITTNSLPADINWAVTNCLVKYNRLDSTLKSSFSTVAVKCKLRKLEPLISQHEYRFFENGCGTDFLDVQMLGNWLNEQGDAFQLQFKNFAFPGQYSGRFSYR